ncbi:mucin-17-like isoform X2 [Patiria miniata]|uniref:Fibronectin type-III domain-containing protein n=1 Tax=Patiria miniata TaxID=46514 RepID=A0A913Z6B0_PATMI|nr:mucin-17-like isoform X2 [Patiria miniata]
MLKGLRNYYTRPRRRGTTKKVLQKEKNLLAAATPEKGEDKSVCNNKHSSIGADKNAWDGFLEKGQQQPCPCNIKLHPFDTEEPVLVLSLKSRSRTVLYKHSGTCSYTVRHSLARGRKPKKSSMNTKPNGDSRSKTGISSAYRDERHSAPYPVAKRQIAKKSTTQLVRDFQPNRSDHPNSSREVEGIPEKRQRLSDTYASHADRGSSQYDRDRGQLTVNGRERSRSRDRDYWQNEPTGYNEQHHRRSRSQGNQRHDPLAKRDSRDGFGRDSRDGFGRYDDRRDASFQASRSLQQIDPDPTYQRNAYRKGGYNRREDQEHIPRWRDGSLSNRGASFAARLDKNADKANATSASRSRDSSPANVNRGIGKSLPPNSSYPSWLDGLPKEVPSLDQKELDKDSECKNKESVQSSTEKDRRLNPRPEANLLSEKEKRQSTTEASKKSAANLSSNPDSSISSRTSSSDSSKTPASLASEIQGNNASNLAQSKEKAIPSSTEIHGNSAAKSASNSARKSSSDSSPAIRDETEHTESGGISDVSTRKPAAATKSKDDQNSSPPGNGSGLSNNIVKNPVKSLAEKAVSDRVKAVSLLNATKSKNTCDSDDVSSHAGVPHEKSSESQSTSDAKKMTEQLDDDTRKECVSSPARPVLSAKQSVEDNEKSGLGKVAVSSRSPSPKESSLTKVSRSPSPHVKQDVSEGSLNMKKLKSIINKAFPKAHSSVAKEEVPLMNKSRPSSPKVSDVNIELEAPSMKLNSSKTSGPSLEVVKEGSSALAEKNHSSDVPEDKVMLTERLPFEPNTTLTKTAVETKTVESNSVSSKSVSNISESSTEPIEESYHIRISSIEGGITVPNLPKSSDSVVKAVDGRDLEKCGPSSVARSQSTETQQDQSSKETPDAPIPMDVADELSLPSTKQSLDDRTNPHNCTGEPSNMDLNASKKVDVAAKTKENSVLNESLPMSEATPSDDVIEPMEISSPLRRVHDGPKESSEKPTCLDESPPTDDTNTDSTQDHEQDCAKPSGNSATQLKVTAEVAQQDASEKGKSIEGCNSEDSRSSPVGDAVTTNKLPSANPTSATNPAPVEPASITDLVSSEKIVSASVADGASKSLDVAASKAETCVPKESLVDPIPTDEKSGPNIVRTGKRQRSNSSDVTEPEEAEDINKRPKLVAISAESSKADLKANVEETCKDERTTEATKVQVDKEKNSDANNPDQNMEVAGVSDLKSETKTEKSDTVVQPQAELPVPLTKDISAGNQPTVPKTRSSPVPPASVTSSKTTTPSSKESSLQPKRKEEPSSVSGSHSIKAEPSKSKMSAPTKRPSSTSPSPVPTPQGPAKSSPRDKKPKQISIKDLRLLIEKHSQVALHSKLELLHRQLEVANKGERAWKERALELQAQLKAVQGQLNKTKGEKENLETKMSEVQEQLETAEKKLQDKGIIKESISTETQYDNQDITQKSVDADAVDSMEVTQEAQPEKGIIKENISTETQYDKKDITQKSVDADVVDSMEVTPETQPEKVEESPKAASDKADLPNSNCLRSVDEVSRSQVVSKDKLPEGDQLAASVDKVPATRRQSASPEVVELSAKIVVCNPVQATSKETTASVTEIAPKNLPASAPGNAPSNTVQRATPPTIINKLASQETPITSAPPQSTTAPAPAVVQSTTSTAGTSIEKAIVPATPKLATSDACPPATKAPAPSVAQAKTSVAVTAPKESQPNVMAPKRAAQPATTAAVGHVASVTPKKVSTPELQETNNSVQVVAVRQQGSLPRGKTSQSPLTPLPHSSSPQALTPPSKAPTPTPSSPRLAPSPRAASPRGKAPTPPKQTSQKPPMPAKQLPAVQPQKAQSATNTPPTKPAQEPECIDLTDDSEEPNISEKRGPPPKQPSGSANLAVGPSQAKMPPPYSGQGQAPRPQNAAPNNTQGLTPKRPTIQQPPPTSQSQVRPTALLGRPRTQAPVPQQQKLQQQQQPKPPGIPPLVAVSSPQKCPNVTIGPPQTALSYPNQRPPMTRIPPVPAMQPVASGLQVSFSQASASPALKTASLVTPNTKTQFNNQALLSGIQTFVSSNVTSTGQSPISSVPGVQQVAISQQQILGINPGMMQRMAVPISNVYFPTAAQAGLPAERVPQPQSERIPQSAITAIQLATIQQQQQQLQQAQKQQQQLQQAHQLQQHAQQLQQQQQQQQQQQAQKLQQQQLQQQQQAQELKQQHQKLLLQQQHQQAQQHIQQQQQQQQQQQIQQQLQQQRIQQQQKRRAVEEQRQNVTVQQQMQLQRQQQQQANMATQEQMQQNQKLQASQIQKQKAIIQQNAQKVQSTIIDLKKQYSILEKENMTLQAKAQTKDVSMPYRMRELEMQQRNNENNRKRIKDEISKQISTQQQYKQRYEQLLAIAPATASLNVNPASATKPSHPAPLPPLPPPTSSSPPKPELNITKVENGIVLSWNMTLDAAAPTIEVYHLYAYQESEAPPSTNLWKKIGEVRALPLPMACTLTMFQPGSIYHFAVCAVDANGHPGPFSAPSSINLPRSDPGAALG